MASKKSALQQYKELQEEANEYRDEARKEALAQARTAIIELKSMGLNYDLVEGGKTAMKGTKRSIGGPCPICNFETRPPHDGRTHRSQGKRKKPFTAADLSELGLTKV